jgi:hypothetical protein
MDIVITGANGAVGTALIRYLSAGSPPGAMRLRAFDSLFNEHLADPDEARTALPLTLTSVQAALDDAFSTPA